MSERAVHIKNLIALKDFCNNNGVFTLASNIEQSLDYAISSLKTDEAYQIIYEGGEIFTKADVVVMLTELKSKMNSIKECEQQIYGKEEWNFVGKCQDVIQSRINKLKGKEDEDEDDD